MWQPSRAQWSIIWAVAALVIFAWPPDGGSSLAAKALSRIVDPLGTLPALPSALPPGLDDDGDAVAQHDALERSYYDARDHSALTRWRLAVKSATDPFERSTERQLLVGLGVVAALAIWRMETRRTR